MWPNGMQSQNMDTRSLAIFHATSYPNQLENGLRSQSQKGMLDLKSKVQPAPTKFSPCWMKIQSAQAGPIKTSNNSKATLLSKMHHQISSAAPGFFIFSLHKWPKHRPVQVLDEVGVGHQNATLFRILSGPKLTNWAQLGLWSPKKFHARPRHIF